MNLIAAFDGAVRKHSDKTFLRSGDVSISYGETEATPFRRMALTQARPPPKRNRSAQC